MKAIIIVVIILNLVFCFACAKVSAESDKAIKQFNILILSRIAGIFFDSSILYFCIHFIRMPNLIAKTISCTSTALINYLIGKHIFKA